MPATRQALVLTALAAVACVLFVSSFGAQPQPTLQAFQPSIRVQRPCMRMSAPLSRVNTRIRAMDAAASPAGSDETEKEMPPGFWEYALREPDLGRGARRIIQVATPFAPQGGKKIIVARVGKEGDIFAFDYMCPHLGVSLADGKFGVTKEGLTIECSQHKSVFNIESGKCEDWLPGSGWNALQRMVTPACNLLTYPTLVRDGNIFVDMSKAKVRGSFEEWVEDRPKMKGRK
eukprot:CAMPEP_0167792670 /NCGR_PEP_ID=MMETSP0111_2-20121227/12689_1 /TAXON_ID=91324 /ORGANISM="Lotharella globosa, Strain CCCM811" /LENGTH=231 /DNA_ID=CAMNT_0007685613 /DNA_START=12 /DNA_END=707 /DNA_ORIENTATION=-